jgi:hypothetical protein
MHVRLSGWLLKSWVQAHAARLHEHMGERTL